MRPFWLSEFFVGCFVTMVTMTTSAEAQSHLEIHRRLTADFTQVLKDQGPDAALAVAKQAVAAAGKLPENDPRRTDALELVVRAQMTRDAWSEVLPAAEDIVQRRQNEHPVEPEILALAVGNKGVAQFALDRAVDAERTFQQQIAIYRGAFGPNDIRLAQKLELQAQFIQVPYERWRSAADLYKEAVAIRKQAPDLPRQKLAETLQSLALVQIHLGQSAEADANNSEAEQLMERAIAAEPGNETLKAGFVQMLVVHAGIENSRGPANKAAKLLARARRISFKDKDLEAEGQFLIAAVESDGLEANGDLDGAIAKAFDSLDVLVKHSKQLDLVPDVTQRIGALYLKNNQIPEARQALLQAQKQVGGEDKADAPLLFHLSELARLEGRSQDQKRLYQRALQSRKEQAAETVIFFGTNRAPTKGAISGTFGIDRSPKLTFGEAIIQVPGGKFSKEASLKPYQASPVPVGVSTDAEHLAITAKSIIEDNKFPAEVSKRATKGRLYDNSVLVFIHGYNNSFDDAVKRTAQLVRDLNFDGAAFSFAWPSRGSVFRYGSDLKSAAETVDACVAFLTQVAQATGAARIHVIAHSMGNRILLPALAKLPSSVQSRFGEIVLASPAVDLKSFNEALDRLNAAGLNHFTLYASSRDKALLAGFYREFGTTLAGFVTADEPIIHTGMQSIDVSEAGNSQDSTNLNHDIFATNPVVTEDLRQLLQKATRPPDKRLPNVVTRTAKSGAMFWYYRGPGS